MPDGRPISTRRLARSCLGWSHADRRRRRRAVHPRQCPVAGHGIAWLCSCTARRLTAVLATLRAYRNRDGGFGHALEPDVRAPESEPASTLHGLEVLGEIGCAR